MTCLVRIAARQPAIVAHFENATDIQSTNAGPIIVATSEHADQSSVRNLGNAGCEVLFIPEQELSDSLRFVLNELGKRRCTNILLEGGGTLLGNAFDGNLIDQIHCFIAPKLIGGLGAVRPIAGVGKSLMSQAGQLHKMTVKSLGDNVHISSFLSRRR